MTEAELMEEFGERGAAAWAALPDDGGLACVELFNERELARIEAEVRRPCLSFPLIPCPCVQKRSPGCKRGGLLHAAGAAAGALHLILTSSTLGAVAMHLVARQFWPSILLCKYLFCSADRAHEIHFEQFGEIWRNPFCSADRAHESGD